MRGAECFFAIVQDGMRHGLRRLWLYTCNGLACFVTLHRGTPRLALKNLLAALDSDQRRTARHELRDSMLSRMRLRVYVMHGGGRRATL